MLEFRFAKLSDVDLYYKWANDPLVRLNSFNTEPIKYQDHVKWFSEKIKDEKFSFYLFIDSLKIPAGQVRFQKELTEIVIGISIDEDFRGKSLGVEMLEKATEDFLAINPEAIINAYIKESNSPSLKIFKKAGFSDERRVIVNNVESYCLSFKR
ncbi:MAG: GNAT family N-acetyltransferase [Bacteroidetes bacterium]|nr:GNAT family N-acetyltransferase [Bacteroidota bacterium]